MSRPLLLKLIISIVAVSLYWGCDNFGDEVLTPFLDPNTIFLKDTCDVDVILFQQQILPVIIRECASSGCHNEEDQKADINLDNYQAVIQLISSNDSSQSKLSQIFNQLDTDPHTPPLDLETVTPIEIQQINTWISQGGLNTNCDSYCEFTEVDISKITLLDNNTPENISDDYYAFSINVKGANLSSAYKLTAASFDTIGRYNQLLNINLPASQIPSNDIVLTLTDTEKRQCVYSKRLFISQGDTPIDTTYTEIDTCLTVDPRLSDITCNDNNTPGDSSDDFIIFYLDPSGGNIGSSYSLNGEEINAIGQFGQKTEFVTPKGTAGKGDINITLTNMINDSTECEVEFILQDPGTCSSDTSDTMDSLCIINESGLANIECNNNGTPDDTSDDYISFSLNPIGSQTSGSYILTGAGINETGVYGQETFFSSPTGTAGNGDLTLTLMDSDSSSCTLTLSITDPGTCDVAPPCNITQSGLSNIECNNNETPDNLNDDYISFTLNPMGIGTSGEYSLTGDGIDEVGIFGQPTIFTTPTGTAGNGDITLTITDRDSTGCTLVVVVSDPGACTSIPPCNISQAGLSNIQCNDNGTPANPNDDYITFNVNPSGQGLSGTYQLTGGGIDTTGVFGQNTQINTPAGTAGQGNINLTITDADSGSCTLEFTLTDPGVCTPECNLLASGLADIACNDNGTPNDPNDDFITYSLNPTGVGVSGSYQVSGPEINETGTFGQKTTFNTPQGTAGNSDIVITISDSNNPNCSIEATITNPGTCTPPCNITQANLSAINCNDNGTPADPNDDYITFMLDVSAGNIVGQYTVTGGGIQASGTYGQTQAFQSPLGSAGKGDITIVITDTINPECTASLLLIDPGVCISAVTCDIMQSGLTNVTCNDNGTPMDNTDDFLTFELNPTGGGLGTTYSVQGRGIDLQGQYGSPASFSLSMGSIGYVDIELTITDNSDNTCAIQDTLKDPYTCESCDVSDISYSQDIQPILTDYCTVCHGSNNAQAGIDLSTYEEVKKQAGNPRFYGAIIHDSKYSPMPPGGQLIPCEIKAIKAWIDQGAPNN